MSMIDTICDKKFSVTTNGYKASEVNCFLNKLCDVIESEANKTDSRKNTFDWNSITHERFSIVENGYSQQEVDNFINWLSKAMIKNESKKKGCKEPFVRCFASDFLSGR